MSGEQCKVNLQWKGIDACYDFYCPCGWEGPEDHQLVQGEDGLWAPPASNHEDGFFKQEFQCGGCGRWWHLSNTAYARPGKFFRDDGYGCDDCDHGHSTKNGQEMAPG